MRTDTKHITIALDFDQYPSRHTCEGANISPRISIQDLDTPYFALILEDPDAPNNPPFIHWTFWNARTLSEIPEDVPPKERPSEIPGAVHGINSAGTIGYTGPCPPPGSTHRYFLRVFGLDAPLDLTPGADANELKDALKGHYREYGETMATYGR